jgi:hypothetical protein
MAEFKHYFEMRGLSTFDLASEGRVKPLIFIEVNNPLRMSPEEIAQDARSSGIDPHVRYEFWQRAGLRPLDFAYVQPRLREEARAVGYLDLFCSAETPEVPSALIANHLRSFISVSVLKGRSAESDQDFATMSAALARCATVTFKSRDGAELHQIRGNAPNGPRT